MPRLTLTSLQEGRWFNLKGKWIKYAEATPLERGEFVAQYVDLPEDKWGKMTFFEGWRFLNYILQNKLELDLPEKNPNEKSPAEEETKVEVHGNP